MRECDAVVLRLQLLGDQQIIFGLEEVRATVNRELKIVTVRDRILGTRLHAVTAENATPVIDVVNGSVTFVDPDSLFRRTRVVGRDDVNALRGTRGSAKITGDALLASEFVDV